MKIKLNVSCETGPFEVSLESVESIKMVGYFKFEIKCFGNGPVTWRNVLDIEILETY